MRILSKHKDYDGGRHPDGRTLFFDRHYLQFRVEEYWLVPKGAGRYSGTRISARMYLIEGSELPPLVRSKALGSHKPMEWPYDG